MVDTTLRDEVQAAEADIASGHAEQALARCQQLQDRYPRALVIQRLLGEAYLALRKPREALGALERALTGDPEDARACCARALIHQIHGDSTAALAWYRRACEIRPDDTVLRGAYRELATSLGQPSYRPTSVGLARLYMRGALYTHAIREWETLLAQQPDRLDVQVGLAETLWRSGDTARADEVSRHIAKNTSSCVKALLIVAALEHAEGHKDEVERLFQRALELDPERRIGRALYADVFASGDEALATMFLGAQGSGISRASISQGTDGPSPEVTETPTVRMTAAPRSKPTTPMRATQDDLSDVNAFAQSRSAPVPPSFHEIFAETEFMLWGRDEEDRSQNGGNQSPSSASSTDIFGASRVDRFERSTVIVPPALADSHGGIEDTEARAAIGWVRWLQAQGARPMDVAPPASVTRSKGNTGTLPPTRQELREMFAELEPQRREPQVIEADVTQASSAADAADSVADAQGGDADEVSDRAGTPSSDGSVGAVSARPDERGDDNARDEPGSGAAALDGLAAFADVSGDVRGEKPKPAAPLPAAKLPLPDIQLAVPLAGGDALNEQVTEGGEDTPGARLIEEVPRDDTAGGPEYLPRLRGARRKRADGRMEEALLEYRSLLRDSPDALDDLIHDLRDTSAESNDPEVHRLLGDAYIREGNYLNALESYNRALALSQGQES
jgi:tetratricopeptide (TPR) repeat protein